MSLTKYKIDGTEKIEADYCGDCNDGQEFLTEPFYIDGPYCSPIEALICSACNTRYELPRVTPVKALSEKCFYYSNEKGDCLNEEYVCLCYINSTAEKLIKQNEMEASEMNLTLLKERYEETGICSHIWKPTHPFKTAEGRFQINACAVCKRGVIEYNGRKYEDDIMKLVTYIAHKGVEYEQQATKQTDTFDKMFNMDALIVTKTEGLANLFEQEEDLNNIFI